MARRFYSFISVLALFPFLCLAVLYFSPVAIPYKLAFPVAFLSIAAFRFCNKTIACAFLFSALGDVAGAERVFLCQMGMFALAHVFFILFFARRIHRKDFRIDKPGLLYASVTTAVLLAAAFLCILIHIPHGILLYATSIYMLLILAMFFLAVLQRNVFFLCGAALFVCSDFVLGVNKFSSPMPGLLIMIPYYAAQGLIYLGAVQSRNKKR